MIDSELDLNHSERVVPKRGCLLAVLRLLLCIAVGGGMLDSSGQVHRSFISRSNPRPPFEEPEQAQYNIRFGSRLKARLQGSMQIEANDNINLSEEDPQADIALAPHGQIGFIWPIDDRHTMQFNLSAGYRWYLDSSSLSRTQIDPSSRLEHRFSIGDALQIELSDSFSIQVDPVSRGEISGDSDLINYHRFRNTAGALLSWQPKSQTTVSLAYDYSVDRTLSGDFGFLDHDDHALSSTFFVVATPQSYIGLSGDYTWTNYREPVQNDGVRYSAGPVWVYHLSRFITFRGRVAYAVARFDETGSIADRSEFEGLSYSGEIQHTLNSRVKHSVQFVRYPGLGFGSNFTDQWLVQHSAQVKLGPAFSLISSLAYENLEASGENPEKADRYLLYLGTGLRLTRNWTVGLGYALAAKRSNLPGRDYLQNRFTVDLTRQF